MLLLGSIRSITIICIKIDNVFFSKTYPSFLTVKEGSTSLTKPLSCPKREDVTALRCSEPLRSKDGGPSKVFAMVVRDGTARYMSCMCLTLLENTWL